MYNAQNFSGADSEADGASAEWRRFRCPLPSRKDRADAFLTKGLGSLLTTWRNEWSFLRTAPQEFDLFLRTRRPRMFAARLTGLTLAAGLRPPVELPGGSPPYPVVAGASEVVLDLIGMRPGRQARLGAAVDLAMVAAVDSCPALRDEAWQLGEAYRVHGSAPHAPGTTALGQRWNRIASAMTTRAHPLARWRRQLVALRCEKAATRDAFTVLHVAHNQLGLRENDEQRVHATLVRSLQQAPRSVAAVRDAGHHPRSTADPQRPVSPARGCC